MLLGAPCQISDFCFKSESPLLFSILQVAGGHCSWVLLPGESDITSGSLHRTGSYLVIYVSISFSTSRNMFFGVYFSPYTASCMHFANVFTHWATVWGQALALPLLCNISSCENATFVSLLSFSILLFTTAPISKQWEVFLPHKQLCHTPNSMSLEHNKPKAWTLQVWGQVHSWF